MNISIYYDEICEQSHISGFSTIIHVFKYIVIIHKIYLSKCEDKISINDNFVCKFLISKNF